MPNSILTLKEIFEQALLTRAAYASLAGIGDDLLPLNCTTSR